MGATFVERWLAEDGTSSIVVVHDDATGRYEARRDAWPDPATVLFAHAELTQVRLWLLGAGDHEAPPSEVAPGTGLQLALDLGPGDDEGPGG